MTRRHLAWFVVLSWVLAMGWNARREFFRPEAERLAIGAATLPPGAAYYEIDAAAGPAGMASFEIDTLPERRGFHLRETYDIRLPGLGPAGVLEIRTDAWLGPGVNLDSLVRRTVRGDDTTVVRARLAQAELRWWGPADTATLALPEGAVVQTEASWPLRYAAAGGGQAGDVRRITLLDPTAGTLREMHLRTLETARRVFPDSADTDSLTGDWFVAGRDTVDAWKVERTPAAPGRETGGETAPRSGSSVWVDEDGRYVEAELPGGLRMRRTAFELAFFRETR